MAVIVFGSRIQEYGGLEIVKILEKMLVLLTWKTVNVLGQGKQGVISKNFLGSWLLGLGGTQFDVFMTKTK